MPSLIFRKGLDLKAAVAGELAQDYRSALVDELKSTDFTYRSGRLTLHLAREFGFCYGVDRAVDYAYQTRRKFPDKQVFLTGEIIHNPHVNGKLRASGIRFLDDPGERADALGPNDVVILPAFGVTVGLLAQLDRQGCTLIDTTCGSVLNVWKNVRRYAEDGFTSVIHGKVRHEETQATASQALKDPSGPYLVVLDRAEAEVVCDYIRSGGDREAFLAQFRRRRVARIRSRPRPGPGRPGQPDDDADERVAGDRRDVPGRRCGSGTARPSCRRHYRAFDTICSATQDRQDAVIALLDEHPLDLMLVVGGYNSSNTLNLARICGVRVPTFHIADDACLESRGRHPLPARRRRRPRRRPPAGCPRTGPLRVGLTSGASTPDNLVGAVMLRLAALAGEPAAAPGRPKVNGPPSQVVVPRRSGGVRPRCLGGEP